MNIDQLSTYLRNFDRPHADLLAEGIVPAGDLIEVYPDAWTLYLEPAPGLSLCFWAETRKLESMMFSLAETNIVDDIYQDKLPAPYDKCLTRADALVILGDPIESRGPFKMPLPMGDVGGWDKFEFVAQDQPKLVIVVQYGVDLSVSAMAFALAKTGADRLQEEYESRLKG